MRDTIHLIAHTKPAAFVLENVIGLADIGSGDGLSPLEMIMRQLRQYGYQVEFYTLQSVTWVDVSRNRTSWKNTDGESRKEKDKTASGRAHEGEKSVRQALPWLTFHPDNGDPSEFLRVCSADAQDLHRRHHAPHRWPCLIHLPRESAGADQ